ncbi:MAG TPA: hypothetical protein VK060_14100 [Ruania sp.]|nr:hypothetical protein [Ruania sp.]
MRVTSVLGAGVGLGLITWAIIRPQPVIYLLGVLVTVVSCGDLFVRWRRTRAEQREGQTPASRRARWRAGALAAGLGVVVVAALVAVPLLARWLPTNQGVLWRSADSYGGPVVHAGALYATYYPEEGPGGTSLNRLDLDDGSLSLSIPGHAYLTSEGDIVARVADTIHYYDHNGQQQWTAEVPGDDGTAGVYAAREGTVVVGRCSRDPSDAVVLGCQFVGIGPGGQQEWDRDLMISDGFIDDEFSREAIGARAPLPEALNLRLQDADRTSLIDPTSGAELARYPGDDLLRQHVYGQVLVVANDRDGACTLDGYRLGDGTRLWHLDQVCTDEELIYPVAPRPAPADPSMAYVQVAPAGSDSIASVLAVTLADGQVQEVAPQELAGLGMNVQGERWSIEDAVAGDLVFRWNGPTITAAEPGEVDARWQAEVPGTAVRNVVGGDSTVAVVSYDRDPGHNPLQPPPPDDAALGEWPAYVTVIDAGSGEVISATRFDDDVRDVVVPEPGRAYVQVHGESVLVGADRH